MENIFGGPEKYEKEIKNLIELNYGDKIKKFKKERIITLIVVSILIIIGYYNNIIWLCYISCIPLFNLLKEEGINQGLKKGFSDGFNNCYEKVQEKLDL